MVQILASIHVRYQPGNQALVWPGLQNFELPSRPNPGMILK